MSYTLVAGDCCEGMAAMQPESVDAIVCDPPYGWGFMGVAWDTFTERKGGRPKSDATFDQVGGNHHPTCADDTARTRRSEGRKFQAWCEAWAREAFRVLKPGGRLLAFGGPRTEHRLVCGLEEAGFVIEDKMMWLYGSGFPKHKSKLKPAYEPICVARKGSVSPLQVDACRIGTAKNVPASPSTRPGNGRIYAKMTLQDGSEDGHNPNVGRWPANVLLDEEAAAMLDAQSGQLVSGANPTRRGSDKFRGIYDAFPGQRECESARGADSGGASRFLYVAKAPPEERWAFCRDCKAPFPVTAMGAHGHGHKDARGRQTWHHVMTHPTVKPLAVIRWLCRLITPPGGVVMDHFMGTGTTGVACGLEGFGFVGMERDPESVAIARVRVGNANAQRNLFAATEPEDGAT